MANLTPLSSSGLSEQVTLILSDYTASMTAENKIIAFKNMLDAIEEYPKWAIEMARKLWNRGEAGLNNVGKPHDYNFAPKPGVFAEIVRGCIIKIHQSENFRKRFGNLSRQQMINFNWFKD